MKKTMLIVAFSLLLIASFVTPVFAAPTNNDQKVPVRIVRATVTGSSITLENRPSDGLRK